MHLLGKKSTVLKTIARKATDDMAGERAAEQASESAVAEAVTAVREAADMKHKAARTKLEESMTQRKASSIILLL